MTKELEFVMRNDGTIELWSGPPEATPSEIAERKKVSAKCGHVTRRLVRKERLTGTVLDFALEVVGEGDEIAAKLKAGEQLSDYELHLMLDVYLPHRTLRV